MDKKIKNLIDHNVFNSNILDYEIDETSHYAGETQLVININVDHFKLWKSSGYFNPKYYELIVGIDDGYFDELISEFLPIVGYNFDDIIFKYKPNHVVAYKRLFDSLNELVKYFNHTFYLSSPWLNVDVITIDNEFSDVINILEEEYDIDTDDIVMIDLNYR